MKQLRLLLKNPGTYSLILDKTSLIFLIPNSTLFDYELNFYKTNPFKTSPIQTLILMSSIFIPYTIKSFIIILLI
jgi:hypothetical protein